MIIFHNKFPVNLVLSCFGFLFLVNCGTSKIEKFSSSTLKSEIYKNQFTGILVIDAESRDTVISYNAKKYFTPASNVKIFTLYTGIKLLAERLPAFKFSTKSDTITILGTGDPTLLHPYFKDCTVLNKIKDFNVVNLVTANFKDDKFGPGWAWEDFDSYFSAERFGFPMYGNVLCINCVLSGNIMPTLLSDSLEIGPSKIRRAENRNIFFVESSSTKAEIPMKMSDSLVKFLLKNLTSAKISITNNYNPQELETAYSISSDSLYKRMMHISDNFLAEQILIMSSSTLSDSLHTKSAIKWITENALQDLKQPPRWVDGSGLSRYNLFTPESFVSVLSKMYFEVSKNRLYTIFPSIETNPDIDGTQRAPFIYAKSGSLSNNYNLSGYLITASNKTLIFSFMNNHFVNSTSKVKDQLLSYLTYLKENY